MASVKPFSAAEREVRGREIKRALLKQERDRIAANLRKLRFRLEGDEGPTIIRDVLSKLEWWLVTGAEGDPLHKGPPTPKPKRPKGRLT